MTIRAPNAITAHHAITAPNVISVPIMTIAPHKSFSSTKHHLQVPESGRIARLFRV
jgi:hypothetical protein